MGPNDENLDKWDGGPPTPEITCEYTLMVIHAVEALGYIVEPEIDGCTLYVPAPTGKTAADIGNEIVSALSRLPISATVTVLLIEDTVKVAEIVPAVRKITLITLSALPEPSPAFRLGRRTDSLD